MKMRSVILAAALFLGACQSSTTVREVAGENRFTQLEGASLVLNQNLEIGAGKARVFVQDGDVTFGFDSYEPHCAFEIKSVQHDGATINADTFSITRVQGSLQQVVSGEPVQTASLQLAGLNGGGDGPSSLYLGYHFWLSSVGQPEVRRMSCYGIYAEPQDAYPPTLREIRQALGSVAEIRQ
ncbi:MAG: hypothetical protein KJN79_03310 [Gammaproteobacteria bacterium]|jgi:hypothetical protein|nr:hypothetical protein [Gammaproteobacteria bacterium]